MTGNYLVGAWWDFLDLFKDQFVEGKYADSLLSGKDSRTIRQQISWPS